MVMLLLVDIVRLFLLDGSHFDLHNIHTDTTYVIHQYGNVIHYNDNVLVKQVNSDNCPYIT